MRKGLFLFRLIVGVAALAFLLININLQKLAQLVSSLTVTSLLLFALLPAINLVLSTCNIFILFRAAKADITYQNLIKKILVSRALGFFLPGKLGEFSLAYLLKDKVSAGATTSILLIDKMITLIVLLAYAGYGLSVFFSFEIAMRVLIIIVLLLACAIALVFIGRVREAVRRIMGGYSSLFSGFGTTSDILRKRPLALVLNAALTAILWISIAAILLLLFHGFGARVYLTDVLSIHSVGILSSLIPLSISGLGIRESVVTYLYAQRGVDAAVAAGIYLVSLFFSYLWSTIVLLLYKFRGAKP